LHESNAHACESECDERDVCVYMINGSGTEWESTWTSVGKCLEL